ncbi:hypothetical protein NDU88_001325 [Pleurodeles waltl]|uniref:Helix-turn-helix domain-containing protein n=1 Tax=Pleurodeles waltl TaxID=8319 RepID=A0AAV7VYM4_PLEWA|nr:hypothetical protein NDU88_001325 [Pleurodeles waltl]
MICDKIWYCLINNFFLFDQVYKQIQGTAMGKCFAPSLANLFIGWSEEQISSSIAEYEEKVVLWCRYIDDIFIIWKGDVESALNFVARLNDNEYNLKLTEQHSNTSIQFLDVEVTVENGLVHTNLYRKKTAGNSLLNARSAHPPNLIKSIPYGDLLKAQRICSTEEKYQQECLLMCSRFQERGYSSSIINQAVKGGRLSKIWNIV